MNKPTHLEVRLLLTRDELEALECAVASELYALRRDHSEALSGGHDAWRQSIIRNKRATLRLKAKLPKGWRRKLAR